MILKKLNRNQSMRLTAILFAALTSHAILASEPTTLFESRAQYAKLGMAKSLTYLGNTERLKSGTDEHYEVEQLHASMVAFDPGDPAPSTAIPVCALTQSAGTGSCGEMTLPAACSTSSNCNTSATGCTVGSSLQCATFTPTRCVTMATNCATNASIGPCFTLIQACIDRTLPKGCETASPSICPSSFGGNTVCQSGPTCVVWTAAATPMCNTSSNWCKSATLANNHPACETKGWGDCENHDTYVRSCITTYASDCTQKGACNTTWAINCMTSADGGMCDNYTAVTAACPTPPDEGGTMSLSLALLLAAIVPAASMVQRQS